jgi:succinate dehydrogenase / fumarate reductase flavoprotein subunit
MHEDYEDRNDDQWMRHSIGWCRDGKVELDYRPVHTQTLTNEISYIKPKARVY